MKNFILILYAHMSFVIIFEQLLFVSIQLNVHGVQICYAMLCMHEKKYISWCVITQINKSLEIKGNAIALSKA